jgi:hypothetical protein
MSAIGTVFRTFHRAVDLSLRVSSSGTLNGGGIASTGGERLGDELFRAVQAMKAEVVDAETGCLDYARLCESDLYRRYRECTARLAGFDPADLDSRERKLAFWINLYNALVVDGVIAFDVKRSVRDDLGFFRRAAYNVGGLRYSVDDIEHGILRANRRHFFPTLVLPQFGPDDLRLAFSLPEADPRIHFALFCGTRSCPPIAAYEPSRIDAQLDLAARSFVNDGGVAAGPDGIRLSRIFHWYGRDFGGRKGVLEFLVRYLDDGPTRDRLLGSPRAPRMRFQSYDWSLNCP